MQVLRNAQDIAGTIKRHQLTGPTWLIAEGRHATAGTFLALGVRFFRFVEQVATPTE